LREPTPEVLLIGLQSGGALSFELLAWNGTRIHQREVLASELNFAIHQALERVGIKLG
jgi:small-conductance mechanosensitive channel